MSFNKIEIPTEVNSQHDIADVVDNIRAIWEACKKIKKYFPSVWHAISDQYGLDTFIDKSLSSNLFDSKVSILLQQDQELRKKR